MEFIPRFIRDDFFQSITQRSFDIAGL